MIHTFALQHLCQIQSRRCILWGEALSQWSHFSSATDCIRASRYSHGLFSPKLILWPVNIQLQMAAPLLQGIRPDLDADLLPLLRKLACSLRLARLSTHTEATVQLVTSQVDELGEHAKVCRSAHPALTSSWSAFDPKSVDDRTEIPHSSICIPKVSLFDTSSGSHSAQGKYAKLGHRTR